MIAVVAPEGDRELNTDTRTTLMGKITWQAGQSNRVVVLADYDGKEEDYRGIGNFTLASGSFRQDSPSYLFNLSWESLVNLRKHPSSSSVVMLGSVTT